ncbi:hypothetical protein ABZ128_13330 [Streptomyces sp. NPDC006326]|uniref:hypothetical protein n=1 Tax=Streptomyces sp. NPDC006326 TaxID=3156752 RepID=UPI00339F9829
MSDIQDFDRRQDTTSTGMAHTAQDKAGEGAALVGEKVTDVAQTAKEQASDVVGEATVQAKDLVGELRNQLQDQAHTQTRRLADNVRKLAGELREMSDHSTSDSPAAGLVRQIADGGHQVAEHLEKRGPDGLVSDLQDFARRRPGVFLAGAALAGFAVARAGKGVSGATSSDSTAGRTSAPAAGRPPIEASHAADASLTTRGRLDAPGYPDPADTYGQSQPPHLTHAPPVTPAPPAYPPTQADPSRPGSAHDPRLGEGS